MAERRAAERTVVIGNPLGIHARPAALVVRAAARFRSEIYLSKGEIQHVNGKSIMSVMMLAAEQGSQVTVRAEGEDAEAAVAVLAQLLQGNFEEVT
ncbi:MAG: HPr family phosphocarrier protein [Candidatus Latescibacterota bacterium]